MKIKIIDLTTLIPGPLGTHFLDKYLKDLDIIKFEDKNRPDDLINLKPTTNGVGDAYSKINEHKMIRKYDLRSEGITDILEEVKNSTVFIQNFKPGRAEKMGLGFEDLKKINPNLIYISISGYKDTKHSAHDLNILALSGLLNETTTIPPTPIADITTSYKVAITVLSKLLNQEYGTHTTITMQESMTEFQTIFNFTSQTPTDYILNGSLPCYTIYETKDNKKVAVACLEKPLWIDFCTHLQRNDLIEHQYDQKTYNEIQKELLKYDRDYWFNEAFDFCVTPIISIKEAKEKNYV